MSTLKVNTIQSNTTSELDINSPLGTVPSLDVINSVTVGGNLNAVGVITATTFNGNLNSTGVTTVTNMTVGGNINAVGVITATTFNGNLNSTRLNIGTGASISSPATNVLALGTNDLERIRIDSNGFLIMPAGSFDLCVGDSNNSNAGSQTISVGSTSSGSSGGIQIWANPTNGNSFIQFGDNSASASQYRGWINYQHADDNLNFGTAGTERIRVGSAGTITLRATGGAFIEGYNADNNKLDVVKLSRMGYATNYLNLVVGKHLPNSTSYTYQSISLNYDPSTNASGSFTGWGNEIFVPNNNQSESAYTRIIQPNTSNNGFNALMSFGSNGEVAHPNQPAFFARSLSNPNTNSYVTSLAAALIFTNKDFDNNNDYNNTNGRFTAPITGAYYFLASILVDDNTPINTVTRIEFRKNGSFCGPVAYFYGPGSCYIQMTAAGCVSMNVGDYLEVWGTNGFIHAGGETHFTGFLL
jgi:hypothetical protein